MRISRLLAVALASGLAAGCGITPSPKPAADSGPSVSPSAPPVQVYAAIARQVHACWFAPTDTLLTKHVFRAEVPARGQPDGQTRIVIYERAPDGRLGLKAYAIRFDRRGKGTAVTTENHRLPDPVAQRMSADVGAWTQGRSDCAADTPAAKRPGERR